MVRSPRGLRRGLALVPGVIAGSARDTTSSLTSVPTMETVPPSLRLMAMGVGRGSRQMPERWARIGGKGCTHPSEGPTGRFVARAGEGNSPRRASPRGGGLGRQLAHQAAHRSSSPRASRVARNGSPVFVTASESTTARSNFTFPSDFLSHFLSHRFANLNRQMVKNLRKQQKSDRHSRRRTSIDTAHT